MRPKPFYYSLIILLGALLATAAAHGQGYGQPSEQEERDLYPHLQRSRSIKGPITAMMGNLFSVSLVLSILLLPFLGRFVGLPHGVIWAYIVGCFIPPGIGLALYYYGGRDFSFNPFASLFAGLLCAFGAHMKSSLT